MKQLILVRHAKSSWDNLSQKDFDRPLNDRGKRDAPVMAERIKTRVTHLDAIITSPAKRALATAKIFADAFTIKSKNLLQEEALYHASPEILQKTIISLSDSFDTVALFAHNPGLTEFATQLTHVRIDNLPTCGVFAVKADTEIWRDFFEAALHFWFFDYPKNI